MADSGGQGSPVHAHPGPMEGVLTADQLEQQRLAHERELQEAAMHPPPDTASELAELEGQQTPRGHQQAGSGSGGARDPAGASSALAVASPSSRPGIAAAPMNDVQEQIAEEERRRRELQAQLAALDARQAEREQRAREEAEARLEQEYAELRAAIISRAGGVAGVRDWLKWQLNLPEALPADAPRGTAIRSSRFTRLRQLAGSWERLTGEFGFEEGSSGVEVGTNAAPLAVQPVVPTMLTVRQPDVAAPAAEIPVVPAPAAANQVPVRASINPVAARPAALAAVPAPVPDAAAPASATAAMPASGSHTTHLAQSMRPVTSPPVQPPAAAPPVAAPTAPGPSLPPPTSTPASMGVLVTQQPSQAAAPGSAVAAVAAATGSTPGRLSYRFSAPAIPAWGSLKEHQSAGTADGEAFLQRISRAAAVLNIPPSQVLVQHLHGTFYDYWSQLERQMPAGYLDDWVVAQKEFLRMIGADLDQLADQALNKLLSGQIKQQPGESVVQYVVRFRATALTAKVLLQQEHQRTLIQMFIMGLWSKLRPECQRPPSGAVAWEHLDDVVRHARRMQEKHGIAPSTDSSKQAARLAAANSGAQRNTQANTQGISAPPTAGPTQAAHPGPYSGHVAPITPPVLGRGRNQHPSGPIRHTPASAQRYAPYGNAPRNTPVPSATVPNCYGNPALCAQNNHDTRHCRPVPAGCMVCRKPNHFFWACHEYLSWPETQQQRWCQDHKQVWRDTHQRRNHGTAAPAYDAAPPQYGW